METFGAPGFDLRHFLYVQWLFGTPSRMEGHYSLPKDLSPISCPSVRRVQSWAHESGWPWPKKEELAFLTPLHTNVLLWLWNLSRLGGVWNTDGVYGIWELLIEQLSDRGRGLATPSKCKSIQSLFSSIWWMKSDFFIFFTLLVHLCCLFLDLTFVPSDSWVSPNSYNLIWSLISCGEYLNSLMGTGLRNLLTLLSWVILNESGPPNYQNPHEN